MTIDGISSRVKRSGELEREPLPTDAGLRVKRKNLPITYEERLWRPWTILAVSAGWDEAEVLQKDYGASISSLNFPSNSIIPKRKMIPMRRDLISADNEYPHLGTMWNINDPSAE